MCPRTLIISFYFQFNHCISSRENERDPECPEGCMFPCIYISINIIIVSLYTSQTSSPFTVKSCSDLCVLLPCPISLSLLCIPWEECRLPEDGKRVAQKQRRFKNYWQSTPWFHLARGPRPRHLQPTTAIPHNLPSTPNRQHQSIKNKGKSKLSKES